MRNVLAQLVGSVDEGSERHPSNIVTLSGTRSEKIDKGMASFSSTLLAENPSTRILRCSK